MIETLQNLISLMVHHGAQRIYFKRLSPNDNSKNQVYLGGDFSALNIIPHGEIFNDDASVGGSVRDRGKASLDFFWIDEGGRHQAPNAGLILYPKYPEVRLSGFLLGCRRAPSGIMTVRDEGRLLLLGITQTGAILGYAVSAGDPIALALSAGAWEAMGVFHEIPVNPSSRSSKAVLIDELRRIFQQQWVPSQKLGRGGIKQPYAARNGGGYTLEAELGVQANGNADPDFMGWEIKQYGVNDFKNFRPKSPVTLMTPEPTGGIYKTSGVKDFLHKFGYADQSGKADRVNFGGRYDCLRSHHHLTGLRMLLSGYDEASGKITDLDGGLLLTGLNGEIAASWSFKNLMAHWNRKHAQAAYVPSLFRSPPPEYSFGAKILLCEQTDFLLFLKSFASGQVYYDPAIKIENMSSKEAEVKRRSQFRVAHSDLTQLYVRHELISLI